MTLTQRIRDNIENGNYVVGLHAQERLKERGIPRWQVEAAFHDAVTIVESRRAKPNPKIEVIGPLSDGTLVKAVWSLLQAEGTVKLVTVYFLDEGAI